MIVDETQDLDVSSLGPTVFHHRIKPTAEQYRAGITAEAIITEAYVNGTPIQALCGWVFVPSRDPLRYPACPECTKIESDGPRVQ